LKIKKNKYITIGSWVLVLMWMAFIFFLSSQPAQDSDKLSRSVARNILVIGEKTGILEHGTSEKTELVNALNKKLRNIAHASVYTVLSMLFLNAVHGTRIKGLKSYLFAFLFCVFYACTDEFHQSFVPGRSAQFFDLVLDCTGAAAGIGICGIKRIVELNCSRIKARR